MRRGALTSDVLSRQKDVAAYTLMKQDSAGTEAHHPS